MSISAGRPFSCLAVLLVFVASLLSKEQNVSAFNTQPSHSYPRFSLGGSNYAGLVLQKDAAETVIPAVSNTKLGPILMSPRVKSLRWSSSSSEQSSPNVKGDLDRQAVLKYLSAIGMQMTAITVYFYLIDFVNIAYIPFDAPLPAVSLVFFFMSLRSRFFSPLDNRRPNLTELASEGKTQGYRDRVMPWWTPPGIFFPIMWILIIAPLRAYASTLIFQANGGFFCDPAILVFMLHLCIGDTWNTINNVERRLGAAVVGVYLVFLSSLLASYLYFLVTPLAGKLLGLTCLWLAVASALVTETWRLNPIDNGTKDKLYPVVGDIKTRFVFELPE